MPHLKETQEGLPIWKDKAMVSLLFAVMCERCQISEGKLVLSGGSIFIALSDRPHRVAKMIPGGAKGFANFFKHSDFERIPPNVVFSGTDGEGKEGYGVLVAGEPSLHGDNVIIPIHSILDGDPSTLEGEYSNVSLFVDNVWDTIGGVMEVVGGTIVLAAPIAGGIAAGVGIGGVCEAGAILSTAGLATPACVAAGAAAGGAVGAAIGGASVGVGAGVANLGGGKG